MFDVYRVELDENGEDFAFHYRKSFSHEFDARESAHNYAYNVSIIDNAPTSFAVVGLWGVCYQATYDSRELIEELTNLYPARW